MIFRKGKLEFDMDRFGAGFVKTTQVDIDPEFEEAQKLAKTKVLTEHPALLISIFILPTTGAI